MNVHRVRSFPDAAERTAAVAVAQFSALWAAATLFHIASGEEWRTSWAPAAAAGWVLWQPGRLVPLVALAFSQAAVTVLQAPFISNHLLLTALVNAAFFPALGLVWLRKAPPAGLASAVFGTWAPAAAAALLAMYFFAVFHKLNDDFFNPSVSCASSFYAQQLARFPWLPDTPGMATAAIYVTILVEGAVFVLLAVRRTRAAGVCLGAMFHWLLALHPRDGFYNFSAMLLALFYLIEAEAVAQRTAHLSERWLPRLSRAFLVMAALLATAQLTGVANRVGITEPFLYLWAAYGAAFVAGTVAVWRGMSSDTVLPTLKRVHPVMAVLPAVVVLNGLSPYLGFKTETSWSMFSNLRTEGGRSNHWVMPTSLQVFDYQRDLVEIVAASDRGLQAVADAGAVIPYFEIRRKPWMSLSYRDGDDVREVATVADDPRYPGPPPWVARKFMSFRPVTVGAHQRCVH